MNSKLKTFLGDVIVIVVAIITGLAISKFVIFKATVNGSSMEPTYHDGDICFALVQSDIGRGDVVILDSDGIEEHLIKRVIGLPGESIQILDSSVYIDGELYEEDYIVYDEYPSGDADKTVYLGSDEYFVLGDNRPVSHDSRYFGAVNRSKIKGVVID